MRFLSIIALSLFFTIFVISCDDKLKKGFIYDNELPLPTTLQLASSKSFASPKDELILTATINSHKLLEGQYPTGTVTFLENDNVLETCLNVAVDQAAKQASCTISLTEPGEHNIVATYSGDHYYAKSTSNSFLQSVSSIGTQIRLVSPKTDATLVAGDTVQLVAQLIRDFQNKPISGSITFKDGINNIAGCTNLQVLPTSDLSQFVCPSFYPFNAATTYNLSVIYNGNENYSDSNSVLVTVNVGKISTPVALTVSSTSVPLGASFNLTATLTGFRSTVPLQTGTFTFKKQENVVCTIQTASAIATCPLSMGTAGSYVYTVEYSGDDANYQNAVSHPSDTVNVLKGSIRINLQVTPALVQVDDPIVLTAHLSDFLTSPQSNGIVTFMDGDIPIRCDHSNELPPPSQTERLIDCNIKVTTAGSHAYYARYGNDLNYADKPSDPALSTVTVKGISAITLEQPNSAIVGNQLTLKANLSTASSFIGNAPPFSGSIIFKKQIDGESAGIQVAQCNINLTEPSTCSASFVVTQSGNHKYFAVYNGDLNYVGSTSTQKGVVIQPATSSIVLKTKENEWIRSKSLTLIATVSSTAHNPTGNILFTSNVNGETAHCSSVQLVQSGVNYIAECQITQLRTADRHIFNAEYINDDSNSIAAGSLSNNVLIPTKITLSMDPQILLPGKEFKLTANIEAEDELPVTAFQGRVEFLEGDKPIVDCKDIPAPSNGIVVCPSTIVYTAPETHIFSVKYVDNNAPQKFTSSSVSNEQISIDTPVPNSPIYLVTGTGKVSISTNGGRSWVDIFTQPTRNSDRVTSLYVTSVGDIYVGTEQGRIYYSIDIGHTWQEVFPTINTEQSAISAVYITTNYELLAGYNNKDGQGVLKQLMLKEMGATWQELASAEEFKGQPINAITAFPIRDDTQITKIIVAHNNGALTCRTGTNPGNGENRNWITNVSRLNTDITSLYVGMDGYGRQLFFGTANGKIYKNNKNLDEKSTDPFGGYCPDSATNVQIIETKDTEEQVKGLFVTPDISIFNLQKDKIVQDFSTIYALVGNKVVISKDAGSTWDTREAPNGGMASSLLVSPILYAANYSADANLPYEREIKISKNNGKTWYSIKESFKSIPGNYVLGAWFVTPQNGYMFMIRGVLETYLFNHTMVSLNGGMDWVEYDALNPRIIYKDRRIAYTTALWVEFMYPMRDAFIPRNTRILFGHTVGVVSLFNIPTFPSNPDYYHVNPYPFNATNVMSSIQPSGDTNVIETATYPNESYNDSIWKGFDGIKYLDFSKPEIGVNPNNHFAAYSLAVNNSIKTWYASTSIAPTTHIIRKTIDNVRAGWTDMNVPYGADKSRIPISLYTTNDTALYASFIKTQNPNDDKNGTIFVTTDDGKTWESLTTQPYSGVQAAFKIFAQYQYN